MGRARVESWETVVAVSMHVSERKLTGTQGESLSAWTVASYLDRLKASADSLCRLYTAKINGDDRRCPICRGQGQLGEIACWRCKGKGHRPPAEVKAFARRVERAEAKARSICDTLGVFVELEDCGGWSVRLFSGPPGKAGTLRLGGFGEWRER